MPPSRPAALQRMLYPILALLLACVLLPTASALYEEQAGLADWHLSHVGSVSSLLFRPAAQQSVVVATRGHTGVLAALSVDASPAAAVPSGDTKWRQVLADGERVLAVAPYSAQRVLSVSSQAAPGESAPATVRAWASKDGAVMWEQTLQSQRADVLASQIAALALRRKTRVQGATPVATPASAFTGASVITVADSNGDSKADVLAGQGGVVALLSGVDGSMIWSWEAPSDDFRVLQLLGRAGEVAVVGSQQGSLQVHILSLVSGSEVRSRSIPFAATPTLRNVAFAPASSAVLLLQSGRVTAVSLFDVSKDREVSVDVKGATHMELLGSFSTASFVAVYGPEQQQVVEVEHEGETLLLQVRNRFTSAAGEDVELGWAVGASEAKAAPLIRAVLAHSTLRVESFKVGSDKPVATLVQGEKLASRGGLKQLWVEAVAADSKSDKAPVVDDGIRYRMFVTCVDDSLSLLEHPARAGRGALAWTREEALAAVLDVQFVELPVGSAEDATNQEAGRYPSFLARVGPQLRSCMSGLLSLAQPITSMLDPSRSLQALENMGKSLTSTVQAMLNGSPLPSNAGVNLAGRSSSYARMLSAEARDSMLAQDYFGFRKLLLVSTASGKLYAMESQTGGIVWQRFMRVAGSDAHENVQAHEEDEQVAPVWKVHVLSHHEAVAIVHDDESSNAHSHLVPFNPLTGDSVRGASQALDFHVATAVVLPFIDSHSRNLLLAASADGQLTVYPKTEEATKLVREHAAEIFFFTVDVEAQVLRGFSVHASPSAPAGVAGVQSWLLRFPHAQERLVSVALRSPHEVVQSAVRVLGGGDGGFLFRYLNPNLLAVATVRLSPAQQAAQSGSSVPLRVVPSLSRTTDPSVNVYLIDSVTGSVLDKFVHRGAEGPVSLLQSENSVLAHFYNAAQGQYELSVVDLFENRAGENGVSSGAGTVGSNGVVPGASSIFEGLTVASLATLGASTVQPFNSFVEPAPQSLQQTFTFKSALTALGVSQTRRGITSKEFLLGLPSGQLYALPRALVDPRRPIADPTPQERAEGLIPYSASLPVDKLRVASHVRSLAGVRGVSSSHALLESTSLVCAYGTDLFCTRINPSQTFDLLNEDFNSPFLIATVSAVFLAIFYTRRMAKAKELAAAWK